MNTDPDITQALQDIRVTVEQSRKGSDAVRAGENEKALRLL